MAAKFKPTPPTAAGWYQVQWGDEEYNGYWTVEVIEALKEDGSHTGIFGWVTGPGEASLIDPDDTQSRWRRVDPPKNPPPGGVIIQSAAPNWPGRAIAGWRPKLYV